MIEIRRSADRGAADFGWLDSRHSFSFGQYHDPAHMGFGPLRVINEDRVAPGAGFDLHGHRDMEILSYVLEGALEHKDSIGNGAVLRPGEVQLMSAGTGIRHSEFNPSAQEAVHFLQIWVIPDRTGLSPRYAQKHFPEAARRGRLCLVAAPEGQAGDDALPLRQDARINAALLDGTEALRHDLAEGRRAWIQVLRGGLAVNGHALEAGDGIALAGEAAVVASNARQAEILLFDLP